MTIPTTPDEPVGAVITGYSGDYSTAREGYFTAEYVGRPDGIVIGSDNLLRVGVTQSTSGETMTMVLVEPGRYRFTYHSTTLDANGNRVTRALGDYEVTGDVSLKTILQAQPLGPLPDPTDAQIVDELTAAALSDPGSQTNDALAGRFDSTFVGALVATGPGIDRTGSSDSSSALNAKIATAIAFGMPSIHIPAGTYKATLTVPVPAQRVGLRIVGDGVGHTVLKATGTADNLTVGDGGSLDAQWVSIEHLTLDGNATAAHNITLNHTRFFKSWDVDLVNATSRNLRILGGVANYFAHFLRTAFRTAPMNALLDGGTAGIGANSCYFDKCHFSGASNANYNGTNTAIGVAINGGDANIFTDCEFIGSGVTSIYLHNTAVNNKIRANQFDGPTVAVNIATAGVTGTLIHDNTGTVEIVDNGTNTSIRQDGHIAFGGGLFVGGKYAKPNITPLRVRLAANPTTDGFRVETSTGTPLLRVSQTGYVETGPAEGLTAHAGSLFDNAANNIFSVHVRTGPAGSTANKGVIVQAASAGQAGNLLEMQDSNGNMLSSIGPRGLFRPPQLATTARPTAAAAGAGATYYDTTLERLVSSNGTAWKDQAGNVV